MSSKTSLAYLGLVLLGMGIGIGGTFVVSNPQLFSTWVKESPLSQVLVEPVAPDVEKPSALAPRADLMPAPSNFVVDVVRETGPAVVRINAARRVKTEAPPMYQDRLFGSQIPALPNEQIERGTGSGFIVNDNGQILTNAHVVAGADEVSVTLKDGRTLEGRVMGTDPTTDVAVIKVDAEKLPVVKVGDSDRLQVGEWAIAIGNPLGLDNTVTTGIVSATGRSSSEIGVGDKRVAFIQTDAAINPGNSGGPLLNANGEVIGMNTAIIQNAQGIGFAIPINKAQAIAEQLISKGKADHAYLGIQMVALTPELKQQLQEKQGLTLGVDQGIVIMAVVPNSPAAQAGLKPGDVIQSIQGQNVTKAEQVLNLVEKTPIGSDLPLEVIRDGKTTVISVTVGTLIPAPETPEN